MVYAVLHSEIENFLNRVPAGRIMNRFTADLESVDKTLTEVLGSMMFGMSILIVMLVFVILDLDRPIRGLIVVSEKNLLDLQASMKADVAAAARPALPASAAIPARAASR